MRPRAPAHAFFSTGDGVTCSLCWRIFFWLLATLCIISFICRGLICLSSLNAPSSCVDWGNIFFRCVVWDGGGNSLFGALLLLSAVLVQLSSMYFWRTSFTLNYPGVNGGGYGGLFLHVATFKRCGKTNLQNEIGFRLLQQTTTTRTPPWNLPTNAPKNM